MRRDSFPSLLGSAQRPFTFWLRLGLPSLLAGVAFVAVQHRTPPYGRPWPDASPVMEQQIGHLAEASIALQVAIHDVIEVAPSPTTIRVCRSLANLRVTVDVGESERLSAVLDSLAGQVGTRVAVAREESDGRALPTILCRHGRSGDYLDIGFDREVR